MRTVTAMGPVTPVRSMTAMGTMRTVLGSALGTVGTVLRSLPRHGQRSIRHLPLVLRQHR